MGDEEAREFVDALNGVFGRHAGHRAAHGKGVWARGTFTGSPDGPRLSRARFLAGEPHPAIVRFSHASGDPTAHDGVRDARGMAVKVALGDGAATDLVTLSAPVFTNRTPEEFLELLRLLERDPETGSYDLARLGPFLETHPETVAAIQMRLSVPPPASYLALAYNGIHAFRWTAADGSSRWVRTRFVPEGGIEALDDDEAMARDPHHLAAELRRRLAKGPARFTLLARLAQDGDAIDDPSQPWPEEREAVAAGTLQIEEPMDDPEPARGVVVFDPMRLCDGIEPSRDKILHFRPRAYSESVARRGSDDS